MTVFIRVEILTLSHSKGKQVPVLATMRKGCGGQKKMDGSLRIKALGLRKNIRLGYGPAN